VKLNPRSGGADFPRETGLGPALARQVVYWDGRELEALRRCVQRGRPYGWPEWLKEIAKRLGLESA
jgi:hypothetical protein